VMKKKLPELDMLATVFCMSTPAVTPAQLGNAASKPLFPLISSQHLWTRVGLTKAADLALQCTGPTYSKEPWGTVNEDGRQSARSRQWHYATDDDRDLYEHLQRELPRSVFDALRGRVDERSTDLTTGLLATAMATRPNPRRQGTASSLFDITLHKA